METTIILKAYCIWLGEGPMRPMKYPRKYPEMIGECFVASIDED